MPAHSNLRPFGQCSAWKLQKDNSWRHPAISWPIFSLTSCSSLARVLVCQPSGPGSIPGMSHSLTAITRGNPIMLLPPTMFLCTTCLCANLLAGFLARDCHEGIQTCDLLVSVPIGSYRRAIVGGTLEFPGQLIALLLVALWLVPA
jgi:hypothetical protein